MKSHVSTALKVSAASAVIMIALAASPVLAADKAPSASDDIIVTGSRIARPDLQGTSPVSVVTALDIKLSGVTRIEDLVNSLPQAYTSQSAGVSNGADGTASVNLRNLGDTRTLVLLDGHRLPPGDPNRLPGSDLGSAADVNNVPAILVKRVDVLTGGASATYGADAVAGVVNFILDHNIQGFKFDASGGVNQHNNNNTFAQSVIAGDPRYNNPSNPITYPTGNTVDGGTFDISGAYGTKFAGGRGHVTAYLSYHKQAAVLLGSRDYSSCSLASNSYESGTASASAADDAYCSGSSNTAQTSLLINGGAGGGLGTSAGTRLIVTPATSTTGAGLRRFSFGSDAYNFAPTNYYQRPDERYNSGIFADYEISPAAKPYLNFTYMNDRSIAQIAPSGTFNNVYTINCSNSLLTTVQATTLGCTAPGAGSTQTVQAAIAKRNVEGGPRQDDLQHVAYRAIVGVKGDVGNGWNYDGYYQYGITIYNENYQNDLSRKKVQNGINNCKNPDGTAVADKNCVAYNIWTGTTTLQTSTAAGVTQAAIDYVSTPGYKSGKIKESVVNLAMTGDLDKMGIRSPFADSGVSVAFGPEYRTESLDYKTDEEFSTGDLLGQGGTTKPSSGSFNVKEFFFESKIPIVDNAPLLHHLGLEAAARYSYYSSTGAATTWKLALDWSPFNGAFANAIRFRGSLNRAARAPTLQDFYASSQLGLGGSSDPCAQRSGGRASSQSLTNCLRTANGDPNFATQFADGFGIARNPASQYNSVTEGAALAGTNLRPEIAITKTIGMVFEPRNLIRGFSATIDYYNINLKDRISRDGYDTILNQCLTTGSKYYCNLVHRDPTNGSLWLTPNGYILDPVYNAGHLKTSGIDFGANYSLRSSPVGAVNISFVGTYLLTLAKEVTNHNDDGTISSGGYYDCVGYYGDNCGVPNPEWRHKMRVTFSPSEQFSASFNWRHFAPVFSEAASNDAAQANSNGLGKEGNKYTRIPAVDYLDISFTVSPTKAIQFRAGVNNVFDSDPPLVPGVDLAAGNVNGNTYPGYYDALGRYLFGGVSLKF